MNPFTERESTLKPSVKAEEPRNPNSYGYDEFIPEPKCLGEVEEPSFNEGVGNVRINVNGFAPICNQENEEAKIANM